MEIIWSSLIEGDSNPTIIAVAHMDTVFRVGTAKERPFTIRRRSGVWARRH